MISAFHLGDKLKYLDELKIEQPVILFHILMKNGKYWEEESNLTA